MDMGLMDLCGKNTMSSARHTTDHPGCTSLHTAVWQNQPERLADLLKAGSQVDVQDEESGWTALHRSLYWGQFGCAAVLLGGNAQLAVSDFKGRTPIDLLSEELKGFLEHEAAGKVYSWGNGSNYQLGTGTAGLQSGPVRLDGLRKELVVQIAAAKFHSAAVTRDGRLFTWGFGRGGRLGHPEFDVHSESAIIVPRALTGLGRRQLSMVAVAKHHTAAVTTSNELFTWGSNRDGRLGYAAVDTQPTPRKVTSLKLRVVAVTAANKQTAVLTDGGAIYSWGANDQGQLGYGTSDSASNAVPRQVEAMKGKRLVALAAAKRHMIVMTSDGDIFTWGHRAVTPRRVPLAGARDVQRSGSNGDVAFHKGQSEISRPHAVAIAAGAAHSCCLTRLGVVLAWRSWDPALAVQEVSGGLAGKRVISIAAGKYRTAAVTDEGDVYMWEGLSKQHSHQKSAKGANLPPRPDKAARRKLLMSETIAPERVHGIKRVTKACVGEKHSLALQCWNHAPKQLKLPLLAEAAALPAPSRADSCAAEDTEELLAVAQEDADWTAAADRAAGASQVPGSVSMGMGQSSIEGEAWLGRDFWQGLEAAHQKIQAAAAQERSEWCEPEVQSAVPSLQRLCERSLAEHDVEPRTCLQIMEYADACGADVLKQFCLAVALSNMDAVLLEARGALESIAPHLLEEMDAVQGAQFELACPNATPPENTGSSLPAFSRRPTAAGEGTEEGAASEEPSSRRSSSMGQALAPFTSSNLPDMFKERSFCSPEDTQNAAAIGRLMRNLKKKLQQIDALHTRQQDSQLDEQQQAKLAQRAEVVATLEALQSGSSVEEAQRAALLLKPLSSVTSSDLPQRSKRLASLSSPDLLQRSGSTVSMDSSGSSRKQRGSKHKQLSSQPSRLSMTEANSQSTHLDTAGETDSAASASASASVAAQAAAQSSASAKADDHSSVKPPQSVPHAAAAEGASPMPSAWQRPSSTSAAGFTVSGFSTLQTPKAAAADFGTPQSHKTAAWPSPSGASAGLFDQAGSGPAAASPSPGGSTSRAKPRKGGLSMFLSGGLEPVQAPTPPPLPAPPTPTPAAEFSWGNPSKGRTASTASLRDIQDQEAASSTAKPEQRNAPSRTPSLLSGHRIPQPKSDSKGKGKQGSEHSTEQEMGWNQVPLEALMRKSSPIAMHPKQQQQPQEQHQQPQELQGPAWGGAVIGPSPPAEGLLQGGKPSLRDIQAEQEQVRESCSRSFGAAGSSPGSGGRDGFASYLQWRAGAGLPPTGTSPGALFPAGTSPHNTRKIYTPSPQQNSKWYIQEARPVVALQDIQTEEVTRELQAQQEAAESQAKAEEAAAAAAAKKAARKQQRQRKQAKLKAAAHDEAHAGKHDSDVGLADKGMIAAVQASRLDPSADTADQVAKASGQEQAGARQSGGLAPGRLRTVVPIHSTQTESTGIVSDRRASRRPVRPKGPSWTGKGYQPTPFLAASADGQMPDKHAAHENQTPAQQQPKAGDSGSKPRVLEVRRVKRPVQQSA